MRYLTTILALILFSMSFTGCTVAEKAALPILTEISSPGPFFVAPGDQVTLYGTWREYNGAEFDSLGYGVVPDTTASVYQNGVELTSGQPLQDGTVQVKFWAVGTIEIQYTVVWYDPAEPTKPKITLKSIFFEVVGGNG